MIKKYRMRKTLVIAGMALSLMACSGNKEKSADAVNPFFTEYATPVSYTHLTLPTTERV